LVTEGYLWTGQYPEAQRILTKGNNQSMELDDNLLNGYWSKDYHGNPKFFIINEAIISKLCVLGEEEEPCFEGAQIGKLEFSFNDGFKQQLFGLIESMKEILSKGGEQVFTKYNVQIGDNIWNSIWDNITARESTYSIDGVYQTENEIFAVLKGENDKFYRLNFSNNTEEENLVFSEELEELTDYTSPETPNFDPAAVEEFAATYNIQDDSDSEPNEVEQLKAEKSKVEAELETLKTTYTALENNYQELKGQYEAIKTENTSLKDFKLTIQKKEKQEMINSFYMLSDEDKKDVIDNIDTYSLEDIEAKLSIICVRNKVSFDIGDDTKPTTPTSYTLQNIGEQDDDIPAWIKLVREVEKQN
jgi:FtsZ-binding cell division protein ZapB